MELKEFDFKNNDEYFQTNLQEIVNELYRLLKYIIRIEQAPTQILPKIEKSLENLQSILNDSRLILEEIHEKKQQVLDFLQNSQNYKDSIQTYEALKQAYKQKFKDQEVKIMDLEQEKLVFDNKISDFQNLMKEKENDIKIKDDIISKFDNERENYKKQLCNFSSLMKQMNLEKTQNNMFMGASNNQNIMLNKEIEGKIKEVRDELQKTKEEYSNRLRLKDQTIEQLQRKIDLLEKETALNEDWQFMMESLNEKKGNKPSKNLKNKGK